MNISFPGLEFSDPSRSSPFGRTPLLSALVLSALAVPAIAQEAVRYPSIPTAVSIQGAGPVQAAPVIQYTGRYDVATHTFHPASEDPGLQEGGPVVLYDNTALNWSVEWGSSTAALDIDVNHYTDCGTASFGGSGATISEMRIGYFTNLMAPEVVAIRVRLYQGTKQYGTLGTVLGDYLLTGLANSVSGFDEFFELDVTLPTPIAMDDGPIGWSYNNDSPPGTTGTIKVGWAGTEQKGLGNASVHDLYLEADDSYQGAFWYGSSKTYGYYIRLSGTPNATTWSGEGFSQPGFLLDHPALLGTGDLSVGSANSVEFYGFHQQSAAAALFLGLSSSPVPFEGGTLAVFPWVNLTFRTTSPSGESLLPFVMPAGLPAGTELWLQCAVVDAAAAGGVAMSNAIKGVTP